MRTEQCRSDAAELHSSYTLCRLTTMGKKDAPVRMSLQTLRVLEAFLENPAGQLAGAEVHQRCGIASGTLYPILIRLESAGWFVSQWESIDPVSVGRPRRRLYRLTATGLRRASEVFASFNRGVLA
jgi:PadR family transcriptional regulator PadR